MKNKKIIMLSLLLMVIGFATVTTTLILNGTIKFAFLNDDYRIYFSSAVLDGEDKTNVFITNDREHITFDTKELKKKNDSSVLEFEVTNNSTQYDARVEVNCISVSDKISVTNDRDNFFYRGSIKGIW